MKNDTGGDNEVDYGVEADDESMTIMTMLTMMTMTMAIELFCDFVIVLSNFQCNYDHDAGSDSGENHRTHGDVEEEGKQQKKQGGKL